MSMKYDLVKFEIQEFSEFYFYELRDKSGIFEKLWGKM